MICQACGNCQSAVSSLPETLIMPWVNGGEGEICCPVAAMKLDFSLCHKKQKRTSDDVLFCFGGEGALHVKSTIFPFPIKFKFTMIFYQKFLKFSRKAEIFLKK
jgi:hypothetical protein